MTTDCPICQETVKAFVTLECEHKICLTCYHQCINHSHNKCSLCRAEIKQMTENKTENPVLLEEISGLIEEMENLDTEIDIQNEYIKELEETVRLHEESNELYKGQRQISIEELSEEEDDEISGERDFNLTYNH